MTKKDYNLVAAAIADLYDATDIRNLPNQTASDNASKLFGIRYTAEAIADVFAAQNSKFNRNTFLAACGINGPLDNFPASSKRNA